MLRSQEVVDTLWTYAYTYNGGRFWTELGNRGISGSSYDRENFTYDDDGLMTYHSHENDSVGTSFSISVTPGYPGWSPMFKAVSISNDSSGAAYNYYYDSRNRRSMKVYPSSRTDEYFYDLGHQMLEDRGFYSTSQAYPYPIDEYIWLGGRPVVMIRAGLSSSWARTQDSTGTCQRNSVLASCNFYFPVTDQIGKPVMMLNSSLQATGLAEYDPFGYPNRKALRDQTAHPYATSQDVMFTHGICDPKVGSSEAIQTRARYHLVDTVSGDTNDYCYLKTCTNPGSGCTSGSEISDTRTNGYHAGAKVGPWGAATSTGVVTVNFHSDRVTPKKTGFVLDSCEYKRYQNSLTGYPLFTPLRFPGQYHDTETDWFENWNRYYDPSTGRYLAPEPMMERPRILVAFARHGTMLQAYTYANGNPLGRSDPTGLDPDGGGGYVPGRGPWGPHDNCDDGICPGQNEIPASEWEKISLCRTFGYADRVTCCVAAYDDAAACATTRPWDRAWCNALFWDEAEKCPKPDPGDHCPPNPDRAPAIH